MIKMYNVHIYDGIMLKFPYVSLSYVMKIKYVQKSINES